MATALAPNPHISGLLSKFGPTGFPNGIDENLKPSWNAYQESGHLLEKTPRDRVISVLGFLHLMNQAGQKLEVNPYKAYEAVLSDEFGKYAKLLTTELRRLRIFDLFRIYKTHFEVSNGLRGQREVSMSFAVMPKRKESLDNVLNKSEGFLYQRELPIFLQERWKKMNIKSKSIRPKSALPRYLDLLNSSSLVGRLPLLIDNNCSLHVSRASGDMLVFRFRITQPVENINWMNRHSLQKMIRKLWILSFKSLHGQG